MAHWTSLKPLQVRNPRYNVIPINNSIWIATNYNDGEQGLIEYSVASDDIVAVFSYPVNFQPWTHYLCRYQEHNIPDPQEGI